MNKQTIRIKYFTDKIEKLTYIDGKSDWIDLRAADDLCLKKGDFALVPLGIAMELPQGYEAHVVPRSSTFKNFGVIQTNHMGVIDESYCGDNDQWFMPVLAVRDTEIHVNDRICQFRIIEHQPTISFEECDRLDGSDRGGFGSTGRAYRNISDSSSILLYYYEYYEEFSLFSFFFTNDKAALLFCIL